MAKIHLKIVALLGLVSTIAISASAFQEQDTGEDQEPPVSEEAIVTEGASEQVKATPERKTIYFVGPRVALDRQQGPGLGKPQSILPRPLVRPGSVDLPSPELPQEEDPASTSPAEQEEVAGIEGLIDGTEEALPQPVETEDTAAQPDVVSVFDPYAANVGPDDFDEGSLEKIDPSGIAVELSENTIETVWQGYERNEIAGFLGQLSEASLSPTLTRLASAIAASRFDLPAPDDDQSVHQFISARLRVFEAQANREAYVGLISQLPEDFDWTPLAYHFARAHLLKGELTDACQVAETQRASDLDPYWARLSTFCMAAAGNRSGVDFQLGILEETTEVDQVFYQLIDQILVEAEQPAGAVLPPVVTLDAPLPADVLTASMARLARVTASEIDVSGVNPLAIPLLLENSLLPRDVHSGLVAYLMSLGVANPDHVAQFITASEFTEEEQGALLAWLSADAQNSDGAEDAAADDLAAPTPFEGDLLNTLLLQTLVNDPANASQALQRYWNIAGESNLQPAVAAVITKLAALPNVERNLGDAAAQSIVVRAAYLGGDNNTAANWSRKLRTSVAGEDPDVDAALVGLIPLMSAERWGQNTAGNAQPPLELWWSGRASSSKGYHDGNLLFTMQEAFEQPVSDDLWAAVAAGPVLLEGGSVSPAVWRSLLSSLDQEDPIGLLTSMYRIMSEVAPGDLPPAMAGTLVAGLRQLGFEDIARAFALEILISQKI